MINLRNILILGTLVTFTSCQSDDECSGGTVEAPLQIHAGIHNTHISKQEFVLNDCLGVYLVSYTNGSPGVLGDVNQTRSVNVEYVHDASGFWYPRNDTDLMLNDEPADLYAYFPYDEEMSRVPGKNNLTAYPFSIVLDQRVNEDQNDFLWAKVPELSGNNFKAAIVFTHLMCRCEINIRLADGYEVTEPPVLRVYNTKTSCTINLRNGVVTPVDDSDGVIIATINNVTTPGYDYTYDAILIPQSFVRGTPFLSITLNDDTYIHELKEDLDLSPQDIYRFNLIAGEASPMDVNNRLQLERRLQDVPIYN